MKAYFFIMKIRIEKVLAYRADVIYGIAFQMLVMFATVFFWNALYSGKESMGGVTGSNMLTYTVISTLMGCVLQIGVEDRIIDSVERGTVATDLLKPINLFGIYFAEDIGTFAVSLFQNVLPILLVSCLCVQIPKPASLTHFVLFLGSFVIGYLVNWLFAAIFGMWAFTAINMLPMVQVKKHVARLLSGSIIPLWFFPDWLHNILNCLPFPYIYQLPLSIYIGKAQTKEIIFATIVQFAWLAGLWIVFSILQKNVTKKVMVQGG